MISYVKSLRKDLSSLFIVALLVILVHDFYLVSIPELFDKGHEAGQIIYKLCLSYTSAFIFYFLVVHIKQQKDKKSISSYLAYKLGTIIGEARGTYRKLFELAQTESKENFPSKEELAEICLKININNHANFIIPPGRQGTLLHYLDYSKLRTTEAVQSILKILPHIDTKLVSLIMNVEDSFYFKQITMMVQYGVKNEDISFLEGQFHQYFEEVIELEKYCKLKKFI